MWLIRPESLRISSSWPPGQGLRPALVAGADHRDHLAVAGVVEHAEVACWQLVEHALDVGRLVEGEAGLELPGDVEALVAGRARCSGPRWSTRRLSRSS